MIGLRTGASGLRAYGEAMEVVGSNIANVNTVGYKTNRTNFQDMLATNVRGTNEKLGKGVLISSVQEDFSVGSMETSTRPTDLALDGEGFFTIQGENEKLYYTRAGNFEFDKEGVLTTINGEKVLMREVDPISKRAINEPRPAQILGVKDAPIATGDGRNGSGINLTFNLDAEADIPPVQFDPTNVVSDMYNFSSSVRVYDERGGEHVVNVVYRKVPDTPPVIDPATGAPIQGTEAQNLWEWYFVVNANEVGGDVRRQIAVGGGFLKFDENGRLLSSTNGAFVPPADQGQVGPEGQLIPPGPPILVERPLDPEVGVPQTTLFFTENPQTLGLNFGKGSNPDDPNDPRTGLEGATAFSSEFEIHKVGSDGQKAGSLESFDIDTKGVVTGFFDNGTIKPLYRLFVSRFINNHGLSRAGDNRFMETLESGQPIVGHPKEGNFGAVKSRHLEKANVDLPTEFVQMIETQRAFQANARIITTGDEMLVDVVNMKR